MYKKFMNKNQYNTIIMTIEQLSIFINLIKDMAIWKM